MLAVRGFKRRLSLAAALQALTALGLFAAQVLMMVKRLQNERVDAVLAFGGYVSAPVLAAALLRGIPYYCHEQNTVPGLVTRLFAGRARTTFLSFPLAPSWQVRGRTVLGGLPIRPINRAMLADSLYPPSIKREVATILITGGSQGAVQMNKCLVAAVKSWAEAGLQIIWQTGKPSFDEIRNSLVATSAVVVFDVIADLYPYYALAQIVVCRAGAATLAELAGFGLPCICIPLPWSAENHQWHNAGVAEEEGWCVRIRQDEACGRRVTETVREILADQQRYNAMCAKAQAAAAPNAAAIMTQEIFEGVRS
ncbi:MAG: UDP-N-acetylglucosamine--N-acetylmuramyl-(pentapeptide) pyrophosphoryl-undecaprenol N-acetylglucosamine transferase, partial [Chitinivibrionales bacterium]|nr:UDP-N-acetylglucosamine--N-acetylmuramyl-(pentapeptide) pyrophosphoryl-undecaprenol N-acetylglucosamine transferase [Chitinivibrionales bacterium]